MSARDQRGAALVLAVLIVALATAAAALMLARQDLWIRQVENLAARAQADAAAKAGLAWARSVLASPSSGAAPARPVLRHAEIEVQFSDPQRLFNLNNLARDSGESEPSLGVFRRLLEAAGLDPSLAAAVIGVLDGEAVLLDPRELVGLGALTPEGFARLSPWVIALPEPTPLNVNSAPPLLLAAAIPGLAEEAALSLAATRAGRPFENIAELRTRLPDSAEPVAGYSLDTASRYALVSSRGRAGRAEVSYEALIGAPGTLHAGVVWRRRTE